MKMLIFYLILPFPAEGADRGIRGMSALLKLGWFFRQEWRRYCVAFVTLLAIAGLIMVPPWLTGRVVDAIATRQLTFDFLVLNAGTLLAVSMGVYLLRTVWRRFLYGASYRLAALLRSRIYNQLTRLSPAFFQRHATGDLMARATNDVTAVEMMAGEGVLALVDGAMTGLIVLTIMLLTLSWKLTLLALLPWPVMAYFMWKFGDELHDAFARAQDQFSQLTEQVQESITGIRVIKAFGRQPDTLTRFHQVVADTTAANMAVARVDAQYDPTIHMTIATSFLLAVGGGAWWIHQGELTVGELTTFTMYLGYLIWPMFAFGWMLNILERGSAAYKRLEELLNTEPDIQNTGVRHPGRQARLSATITAFHYPGATTAALHDIRFELSPGKTLGIVGPTGAGKSTLLHLLPRLHEGRGADIRLDDVPVQEYDLEALRAMFGIVPQDPFLFSTTVADNIALGCPDAGMTAVEAAACLACVADDIARFPAGYATMVGERGITLSGGQKQRIALARALLLDPEILVLDDALSAVDVRTEHRILAGLRAARRGRTTLIVAHRLSAVMHADEIIVLRHGTITERGDHETLMQHNGWYAQMFRYQQIERAIDEHP